MNEIELIHELTFRLIEVEKELAILKSGVKPKTPKCKPVDPYKKEQDDMWADLQKTAKRHQKIDKEEVIRRKEEGMSVSDISDLMGISKASAYAILRNNS